MNIKKVLSDVWAVSEDARAQLIGGTFFLVSASPRYLADGEPVPAVIYAAFGAWLLWSGWHGGDR